MTEGVTDDQDYIDGQMEDFEYHYDAVLEAFKDFPETVWVEAQELTDVLAGIIKDQTKNKLTIPSSITWIVTFQPGIMFILKTFPLF